MTYEWGEDQLRSVARATATVLEGKSGSVTINTASARTMLAQTEREPAGNGRRLRLLVQARADVDLEIGDEVGLMRNQGATWTAIADHLGVSRQATVKRYGRGQS